MTSNNQKSSKNSFEPVNKQVLETWPLSRIKIDPKHPRKVTKKQLVKAESMLLAAHSVPPIMVDSGGILLNGQPWFEAAKNLGAEEVQVLIVGTLTRAQAIVYRNAHDKILELGEWDKKNLAEDFAYLVEAALTCEIDFSVEATGFEVGEIDFILSEDNEVNDTIEVSEPDAGPAQPTVTKLGDVWQAGPHRLYCVDSTQEHIYLDMVNRVAFQLINTDPPYNVPIPGFVSGNGTVQHENFSMGCGEMSDLQYTEFLRRFLAYALTCLIDGGCVYLSIDWRHVDQLIAAAKSCGLVLLNICVWDKGVGAMGSLYRSQHEFILVFRKGKAQHLNNVMLGKYGRNRTNVWSYPSANMTQEGRRALKDHPTPKPVAMFADIMRDVTKPGDAVLDPFLGGGTTLIAAEKTGRICYGIELEPKYIDASIRRWQQLTGKQAIHAETGLTFAEHERRVLNAQNA